VGQEERETHRANLAEGRPMRPILLIGLAILSASSAVANVVDTAVVNVLAYYPNGNVSLTRRLDSVTSPSRRAILHCSPIAALLRTRRRHESLESSPVSPLQ